MVDQRERSAIQQAGGNAQLVESALRSGSDGLAELITGLGTEVESAVLLVDDDWTSGGNLVDPKRLPAAFLAMAQRRQAVHQRTVPDGVPCWRSGFPCASSPRPTPRPAPTSASPGQRLVPSTTPSSPG